MALQKTSVPINFASGLETKTDPFQVPAGKFLVLTNSVFTKGGLLQKRNGYNPLADLPDTSATLLTTFNGNLTAIGNTLQAYSNGSDNWVNKGSLQLINLDTLPLIRSNTFQSQCDSSLAPNGLICTVFTDNITSGGSTVPVYKYVIADSITGQNIVAPSPIPVTSGTVTGSPRIFLLGNNWVIVFDNVVSAVNRLQFITISIYSPTIVSANIDISGQYTPNSRVNFDGVVAEGNLYLAWNGNDGGGAIRMRYITSSLALSGTMVFPGHSATILSICADTTVALPIIYVSFYSSVSSTGYTFAVTHNLGSQFTFQSIITATPVLNIASSAQNSLCTVFYEVDNAYSYDSAIKTNYIEKITITSSGTVGSPSVVERSVGLASKSFILDSKIYMLSVYTSPFQPTFFLIDSDGNIVAKLAYSNSGPYLALGLPSVSISGTIVSIPYLIKDLIQAVNKTQGAAATAGVYSQTGINLVNFNLSLQNILTSEIGGNLNISGGFLWAYDGYLPVEQGFFLWPDSVEASNATTGGFITAQPYYYVATYEWADNQGNVFRSAPSIPVSVDLTSSGSSTNAVTVNIPTLRLTYKIANPVKIVLYRWSAAQQTYYEVTSLSAPLLNDPTVDSVSYVDTKADSSIIGNTILYTTGGVLENIGPPATSAMTLFQSRLFLIDSEDRNLLWFSKQVIEATPVEMSDLLTIYIAPTTGAQGSTGPMTALSSMDDKLIIFKKDAIYYITGQGPDNTGANSQFSEPVFITSSVGCANPKSIVLVPQGIMFQSDKGIWLLGRDLTTSYIGSPVEAFNTYPVTSALSIPATTQVRFTTEQGTTLMYDYFYGQWGAFNNMPAISSCLYEDVQTYLNIRAGIMQETPGAYLDASNPVLMSFTTSWMNLAGLQGFERAYYFYLLATFYSPHKMQVLIGYDYNSNPTQSSIISPDNYNPNYGLDPLYGSGTPYGDQGNLEQWRVFLQQQKCQSFQITINELFDPTLGAPAGAGFTMSGLNLIIGAKSGYPRLKPSRSVG